MALSLNSVSFAYAQGTSFEQRALDDVSLSVEPGQLLLVLGATGSGKSTLLRIAAGLLAASEGAAEIDGAPLTRSSARGSVGLVFQDAESQLFAETLRDDVAFGPRNLGVPADEARNIAEESLDAVGLDPATFADRSPFALSGGEARRAAIAGVLALRPRYLLLDEPTSGLDAAGRRAVRDIVVGQMGGSGVIVVSHSAEEFLDIAADVLLVSDGRTAFSGPAGALLRDPGLFAAAGLIAPDVLSVMLAARDSGMPVERFSLDPEEAAGILAESGRRA